VHDLNGIQATYQHIAAAADREQRNGATSVEDLTKTMFLLKVEGILLNLTANNIKQIKAEVSAAMRLHYG
jgi:hypothetical protein